MEKWLQWLQRDMANRELALKKRNKSPQKSGYVSGYTGYKVVTKWLRISIVKQILMVTKWLQILNVNILALALGVTTVTTKIHKRRLKFWK